MNNLLEIINHPNVFKNSHKSFLMEKALLKKEALLGPHGELIVHTGKHTGRSSNDRYIVVSENTENKIWWENNLNKMTEEVFQNLRDDVISFLKIQDELFYAERSIGSTSSFSLGVEFVSTSASAAIFADYMFKDFVHGKHNDNYKIIHVPFFELDPKKFGTRTETVV
ncbi:MAG: phosphoenolpyruvate carboxykinase (ATP), partial [Alphaproteobacteria bacterium]